MKMRAAVTVVAGLCIILVGTLRDVQTQSGAVISSVAGPLTHGTMATIAGSGFGSKSEAAPIKFDDFQNLALGQELSANGWEVEGFHAPVAASANLRPGTPFTRNAHAFFESGISFNVGGDTSNFHLTGLTNTRYYLDAWHFIHTDSNPQPQNIKPWRLHQANAGVPNAYFAFFGPSSPDTIFGRDGVDSADSGFFGSADNGVSIPLTGADWYDHWLHMQVMLDVGTPGTATGTMISYINGRLRMNYRNITVISSGFRNFPEVYFGNYVRSDPHGNTHAYWDSVYLDRSWARVEIGDNPNYASCTHREIQVPTAWAPNALSVQLNRGSFSTLSGAYLFVVDANGNASAGFRLGSGSPPTAPASPSALRIVP